MVDPKVVELSVYNGIPHLMLPVVTEPKKASAVLQSAVVEMENRFKLFAEYGVRDLAGFNQKRAKENIAPLPQIVIIVDELADLMMVAGKEVEESICRLAQLARAAGIHLIIATQRPSVQVVTGLIRANFPGRIAFAVSSSTDSRIILDAPGAHRLIGRGDMLFSVNGETTRLQCPFIDTKEIVDICDFIREQEENDRNIEHEHPFYLPEYVGETETGGGGGDFIDIHELIEKCKNYTYESGGGSGKTVEHAINFNVPEGGYDGSKVTLRFYHTMSATTLQPTLDKYIAKFNEEYPNIEIVHEAVGGYDDVRDQISTEIGAGNQPNIAYCYADHVALYNMANAVTHLDKLIEDPKIGLTQAQIADFVPGYYDEGRQFGDGLMYTMPFSKSTEVLYYNVEFFEQHELTIPTHWFTNDENDKSSVEYVCSKIKEIDPGCIPLGYDSEANWFITMAEQCKAEYTSATGNHYLFDNSIMHTVALKLREWYQKGYVTTQNIYGAYTSGLFINTDPSTTRSYMSIGSSAGATHQRPSKDETTGKYPFTVGIASIPQMSEKGGRVISQGPSVCIFQKSNPQEVVASWLFVKFLTTSTAFQAEFSAASGYVPVLKSVKDDPAYKKNLDSANGTDKVAFLSAKVCMEQVDYYYASPAFNGSSVARDQVGALLPKVMCENIPEGEKYDEQQKAFILQAFKDAIAECEYQG